MKKQRPKLDPEAIRRKLELLRAADKKCQLFGAGEHGYRLNRCATEKTVQAFEKRHGIRLPEDYRAFLRTVGNGGAGPSYGLFPLGVFSEDRKRRAQSGRIGDLARRFPHRQYWNVDDEFFDQAPDIDEDEAAYDAYVETYYTPDRIRGSIPICHEGCGFYYLVVITGPERGNIWIDARASQEGIGPVGRKGGGLDTFVTWYCDWLDDCLKKLRIKVRD